mmetsp:Transcript_39898/g.86839  ORF Transcript_39898/g.86839 Transcript_39898/m.86839 type:complete len:225 (-) Transcript_39898:240-914(-)
MPQDDGPRCLGERGELGRHCRTVPDSLRSRAAGGSHRANHREVDGKGKRPPREARHLNQDHWWAQRDAAQHPVGLRGQPKAAGHGLPRCIPAPLASALHPAVQLGAEPDVPPGGGGVALLQGPRLLRGDRGGHGLAHRGGQDPRVGDVQRQRLRPRRVLRRRQGPRRAPPRGHAERLQFDRPARGGERGVGGVEPLQRERGLHGVQRAGWRGPHRQVPQRASCP